MPNLPQEIPLQVYETAAEEWGESGENVPLMQIERSLNKYILWNCGWSTWITISDGKVNDEEAHD